MSKNLFQLMRLLLVLAVLVLASFYLRSLNLKDQLGGVIGWVEGFGFWAPLVFMLIYILTAGYVLPVVVVTIAAGVLFGILTGSLVVSAAFTLSSVIVYFLGRFYGKKIIPQSISSGKKFKAVTQALKEDGFKIVLMMRFVPVFSSIVLNLTCGMVKIRFKDFTLATFLGQLPGTILFTYMGHIAKDVVTAQDGLGERSMAQWVMLALGAAATLGVVVFVTIKSKKVLEGLDG